MNRKNSGPNRFGGQGWATGSGDALNNELYHANKKTMGTFSSYKVRCDGCGQMVVRHQAPPKKNKKRFCKDCAKATTV